MEFRQLKYFIAVAEAGNMAAAAKRLHVSQPPITRQMQALEADLGVVLLERSHRGIELTAAGHAFLEDARRILELAGRSGDRSRAAARGDVGELSVAYFGTPIYRSLPLLLRAFLTSTPTATVSLTHMTKDEQVEGLLAGTIHVGFSRFFPRHPGIEIVNIAQEDLYLAVHRSQSGKFGKTCKLADLRAVELTLFPRGGRPSFADEVIGLFKHAGIEPRIARVVEDATAALALTMAGAAPSIVPASVAAIRWPDIAFARIVGTRVKVPISCIFRKEKQPPILARFVEHVRRSAKD
uniref:FldR1 n=1 Tax=Paraburkholderia fungorum TaxID=134537 RepID=R4V5J0_9BURK|nr:FldR1 [Paraburkholderia fungorum]